MKRRSVTFTAVALAVALQGCAALPGGGPAPLDTYELTAPSVAPAQRRRGGVQILVAEPTALKALDGENIVVRPSPGSIQYLKGAQWADRLPKIVQARLAQSLQESGRFGGVGRPGEGLAIDYQLIVDIRAFDIDLGGNARARTELFVRVLNDRNGTVRAAQTFTSQAPVSGTGNDAYVAALDAAFARAATQIVEWSAGVM